MNKYVYWGILISMSLMCVIAVASIKGHQNKVSVSAEEIAEQYIEDKSGKDFVSICSEENDNTSVWLKSASMDVPVRVDVNKATEPNEVVGDNYDLAEFKQQLQDEIKTKTKYEDTSYIFTESIPAFDTSLDYSDVNERLIKMGEKLPEDNNDELVLYMFVVKEKLIPEKVYYGLINTFKNISNVPVRVYVTGVENEEISELRHKVTKKAKLGAEDIEGLDVYTFGMNLDGNEGTVTKLVDFEKPSVMNTEHNNEQEVDEIDSGETETGTEDSNGTQAQ